MLTAETIAHHLRQLRENRHIAMTCARASRALGDAEMLADFVRQARIATRLIVNARQMVRA